MTDASSSPDSSPLNYLAEAWDLVVITPFDLVGLADRPITRGLVVGAVAGAAIWYWKPAAQFFNGKPRNWKVTNPGCQVATLFPWWFVAGVTGGIGYALI